MGPSERLSFSGFQIRPGALTRALRKHNSFRKVTNKDYKLEVTTSCTLKCCRRSSKLCSQRTWEHDKVVDFDLLNGILAVRKVFRFRFRIPLSSYTISASSDISHVRKWRITNIVHQAKWNFPLLTGNLSWTGSV